MKLLRIALVALLLLGAGTLAACDDEGSDSEAAADEVDVDATVAEIDRLLDEMLVAYEAGETEEAGDFAAEAYLDNYEHLEHAVEEVDEDLNEELEELLGTEMRAAISDDVPATELRSMVEEARTLLVDAVEAIEAA